MPGFMTVVYIHLKSNAASAANIIFDVVQKLNLGSAWACLKTITSLQYIQNRSQVTLEGFNSDADFANALNCFSNSFDISDFSNEIQELSDKLKDNQHFEIDQNDFGKKWRTAVGVTRVCLAPVPA